MLAWLSDRPARLWSLCLTVCAVGIACGDDPTDSPGEHMLDAARPATPEAGPDAGEAGTRGPGTDAGRDGMMPVTMPPDAGMDPAVGLDAGTDAGVDAATDGASPDAASPMMTNPPALLSQTGLFSDVPGELLGDGVMAYAPRFELWSDSALKRRWLYLPDDTQIDTSDMDAWVFPVGTKAWKEFSRNGVRVETRLLVKTESGWRAMAYLWRGDGSDADAVPNGVENASGTPHDVPDQITCEECHNGRPDRLLGVAAIQLAHDDGGMTLSSLAQAGRLTLAPPASLALPGDATAQATLGAMHANCGHCHNPDSGEPYSKAPGLELWLTTSSLAAVTDTPAFKTTVGVDLSDKLTGYTKRAVAGAPDESGIVARVEVMRGTSKAMPPIATEMVDDALATALRAWIMALAP